MATVVSDREIRELVEHVEATREQIETTRANSAAMRRDIEAIRQLLGLLPLTSRPRLAVVLEDEDDG